MSAPPLLLPSTSPSSPSALVDALSAPIQAMSEAEKRAKQMAEMGIDESDISDVPIISSSKDKKQVEKKESAGQANGKQQTTANKEAEEKAAAEKAKKEKGQSSRSLSLSLSHDV